MKAIKLLMSGAAALLIAVMFTQCNGGAQSQPAQAPVATGAGLTGIKVAYVEIDTLLSQYNFCIDLNEAMVKKSENVRLTLNQKAKELEKQKQDFQNKYENNAFLTQERAQQEYNRIAKLEQDLQELSTKLQNELLAENEKNNLMLRDSIKAFIEQYNAIQGYSLIFSNTGLDNLLFADPSYNITNDIVSGLNARYSSAKK